MARPTKAALEAAVKAAQLYHGSENYSDRRSAQKLYVRLSRHIERIAKTTGMSETAVSEQLAAEAKRRGHIRPLPGHHI